MTKKLFAIFTLLSLTNVMMAEEQEIVPTSGGESPKESVTLQNQQEEEINAYSSAVILSPGGKTNWFISISAGASDFIGTPMGGGMFSRVKPLVAFELGKWYTPTVGSRLVLQGFKFVDSENISNKYEFIHLDLLYNLSRLRMKEYTGAIKSEFVPFFGFGFIHNSDFRMAYNVKNHKGDNHPFTLSYGLIYRHRLNDRLTLKGELGVMTTFQSFDSNGVSDKLGDHMVNLSVGLSIGLGKQGWRHVVVDKNELF